MGRERVGGVRGRERGKRTWDERVTRREKIGENEREWERGGRVKMSVNKV